jgi:hypothetical protein
LQITKRSNVRVRDTAVEKNIDKALRTRERFLCPYSVSSNPRQRCIWHVHHGGDSAMKCSRRSRFEILLVVPLMAAILTEMHMKIDEPGEDETTARVEGAFAAETLPLYLRDEPVVNAKLRLENPLRVRDPAFNDQLMAHVFK